MEKMASLWLLFAGLNIALAADVTEYFMEGGKLTLDLRPPSSVPIVYILWKYEGSLLGEWVKDKVDLTYYRSFIGRTTLNTNTGRLEISSMTKADAGVYSVEINNKLQTDQYKAVLIKPVPKPKVWIRPLTCGSNSESCTATCEGDVTGAEPVTYSWRMGDGEWKESKKTIDITKAGTKDVKTFTCRVKNPLTESESEPEVNPLFGVDEPGGLSGGEIVGIIFGVLVVVAPVVALGVARFKNIGPFKNRGSTSPDDTAENGGVTLITSKDTSAEASAGEVRELLKENSGEDTAGESGQPGKDTQGEDTAGESGQPGKDTPGEDAAAETAPLNNSPAAPGADEE